jgi:hypothetical protein
MTLTIARNPVGANTQVRPYKADGKLTMHVTQTVYQKIRCP